MRVLCFDPGKTVGYVNVHDGVLVDAGNVEHGSLSHLVDHLATYEPPVVVLVERISPRPSFGWDAAFTCEQVGFIFSALYWPERLAPTKPAVNAMLCGSAKASKSQIAAAAQACSAVGLRPKAKDKERPLFWTDPKVSACVTSHTWDAVALYAAYMTATPADREGWKWGWWE